MKIAILGTRGIPASYSGFETAVEQLAARLTERGHEVIVYCRPHVVGRECSEYKGAQLVHLPTIHNKYLDTFVHTFLSALHAARIKPARRSAVLHRRQLAAVPDHPAGLDPGADQRRRPGLRPAQVARAGQGLPALRREQRAAWADQAITDSHAVADIFERRYGQRIGVVPYGVEDPGHEGREALDELGLQPRKYILFVGRLEPENNPHLLVEAFARLDRARVRGMKGDRRRGAVRRRLHPPGPPLG